MGGNLLCQLLSNTIKTNARLEEGKEMHNMPPLKCLERKTKQKNNKKVLNFNKLL